MLAPAHLPFPVLTSIKYSLLCYPNLLQFPEQTKSFSKVFLLHKIFPLLTHSFPLSKPDKNPLLPQLNDSALVLPPRQVLFSHLIIVDVGSLVSGPEFLNLEWAHESCRELVKMQDLTPAVLQDLTFIFNKMPVVAGVVGPGSSQTTASALPLLLPQCLALHGVMLYLHVCLTPSVESLMAHGRSKIHSLIFFFNKF